MQLISSLCSEYIAKRLNSIPDCSIDKCFCATSLCFRDFFFLFLMSALKHLVSCRVGRARNSWLVPSFAFYPAVWSEEKLTVLSSFSDLRLARRPIEPYERCSEIQLISFFFLIFSGGGSYINANYPYYFLSYKIFNRASPPESLCSLEWWNCKCSMNVSAIYYHLSFRALQNDLQMQVLLMIFSHPP